MDMKTGKSLVELAQELERITKTAKDYVVPVEKLQMAVENDKAVLEVDNNGSGKLHFQPTNFSHSQIAAYSDVPKAYYDRISQENPKLLADSVNHGIQVAKSQINPNRENPSRMLRTIDGRLRAFLSSRYRRLDSYDLLNTALPVLIDHGFEIRSAEYTDMRMYLQAVTPKVQSEVKAGDVVQYGLTISSSDVGAGSLRVEPLVFRLVCQNGLIMDTALRKFHIGREQADADTYELLTDDTKKLTDEAFWAQVRDIILASMKPERFERHVNSLREAASDKITNYDIEEVVELSMKAINVTGETTKQNIVAALANGADGAGLTRWGLINAFTESAHSEAVDYDTAIDIQRNASRLLTLAPKQWERIAKAS